MGRFTKWLNRYNPRTGRLIKEDGKHFNEADHFYNTNQSDLRSQSLQGNMFRVSATEEVPIATTETFVLNIPINVSVNGFARYVTVNGGDVNSQFLVADSKGSVLDTIQPKNFDQRQSQARKESSTVLERVSGVTGAIALSPLIKIVSPTTGFIRAPSTQTESGAIVPLDNTVLPVFTITNVGNVLATVTLELYFTENVNES